jgi:hypothetical protein
MFSSKHIKRYEFCMSKRDSSWLYHNFKNAKGEIICQKAVQDAIVARISKRFSINTETFVFSMYKKIK